MTRLRHLIVALAVCCLPLTLGAQAGSARLTGTVTLVDERTPVPGAVVVVVGTGFAGMTDSAGSFVLAGIPGGLYAVEVRRVGLAPVRRDVALRDAQTTVADFELADAPHELVGIQVVGSRSDALARLPGAATVVSREAIAAKLPLSANEMLRTVPGLHVQEEEGAGLRANIGIRGLDPDRSRTVLVLEDGVPVSLAPYGEPEMYYSPPIDRMDRIEVVKGSGSILFGPQTIGGVVNYVTAEAPVEAAGRLHVQGGTGASLFARLGYGGTWGPVRGTATAFRRQANDLNGLWYDMTDATGKVALRGAAGDFGIKLSAYDERSNSTYVGLTDSLFRADPHRHPAPDDQLTVNRYAVTGTHDIGLAGNATLHTAVYGYQTTRDWRRQNFTYSPNRNAIVFSNATGNRNRSFDVLGIEPRLRTGWMAGSLVSELEAGVRAHYERARDQYIAGQTSTASTGLLRDDEIRTGRALAAFAQNRFFLTEELTLTPGARLERFEFDRHILRARVRRTDGTTTTREVEDVDIREGDAIAEFIPGIGAAWSRDETLTIFGGAHRGFAPPRAKDALVYSDPTIAPDEQVPDPVSLQLEAERSWNYELGARVRPSSFLSLEATAFLLDFSNQIIEPSLSAGSVAQAELANQGATRHRGVEGALSFDVARLMRRPYSLTAGVTYTYADAVFSGERLLAAGSDTVNIEGNRLPYAPLHTGTASLTLQYPRGITVRLDGIHVSSQFTDNFETVEGSANGRTGRIPAYRVFDLSAQAALPRLRDVTVLGSVKNLTNETYIASRRPQGIKPGLPRVVTVGLAWGF